MDVDNVSKVITPVASLAKGASSFQAADKNLAAGTNLAGNTAVEATSLKDQQSQNAQQLQEAVSRINDFVQNEQRSIRFSVDEASGRDVVTVLDKQTEEVIRQIPIEEVLVFARNLAEQNADDLNLFNGMA